MQEVNLAAETRELRGSSHARRLRRDGRVPAIVYGLDTDSQSVTVEARELYQLLAKAGSNVLINLQVDGGEQLTMAREVQRHPIRGELVHVDFVRIREDVAVEADVPIHLVGEPVGLKEGGVLEHVLFEVEISAKPREIPTSIELDVTSLEVGEQKRVEDLAFPAGVEPLTEPERVVANVVIPRLEEEEGEVELSEEELEELEGLSEEELEELKDLAAEISEEIEGEAEAGEVADEIDELAGEGGEAGEGEGDESGEG